MKNIFLFISIFVSVTCFSQTIPGYSGVNGNFNYRDNVLIGGGLTIPAGTTPALGTSQNTRSGALYYDTTGTDTGLYVYHHPYFVQVGGITGATNGLQKIGPNVGLGGTATQNTTTAWGAFTHAQSWTNLGANTGYSLTGTGTVSGNTNTVFSVGTSGSTSLGQRTYGAQISNTRTGVGGANVALRLTATGKTGANFALIVDSGYVGIGENLPGSKLWIRTNNMHETEDYSSGLVLSNDSNATASYDQVSPTISLAGQGWKTDATAGSAASIFKIHNLPIQGTAAPGGILKFQFSNAISTGTDVFSIGSSGQMYDAAGSAGTTGQVPVSAGSGSAWAWGSAGGGSQTLQDVFDQEAGNAVTNKDDTISIGTNDLVVNGSTTGGFYVNRGAIGALNISNGQGNIMVGSTTGLSQNTITSTITNTNIVLQGSSSLSMSGGSSTLVLNNTNIAINPFLGELFIDSLDEAVGTKALRWNAATGKVTVADTTTGGASGLTVGTTTITSGTNTRVLYNNSGVLGEYAVTGTGTTAVLSTSPTFTTSIISPLVLGGTGTGSSLTLQSTSGVGATDFIDFKVGNNGATQALHINTAGESIFGTSTTDNGTYTLQVNGPAIYTGSTIKLSTGSNTRIDYSTNAVGILGNTQTYLGVSSGTVLVDIRSTGVLIGASAAANSSLHLSGSLALTYTATATGITLSASHQSVDVTATGQTITLPTAVGITGRVYTVKLTASGTGTVATTSSQTIDGSTTYSLSAQYKYVTVQSNGANWNIVANN